MNALFQSGTIQQPSATRDGASRDPYIAAATWKFARTLPTIPHWDCLGERSLVVGLGAGHEALFALIVDHGDDRWWRFKTRRSIELDGFLYWIIEDGTAINRRPADCDLYPDAFIKPTNSRQYTTNTPKATGAVGFTRARPDQVAVLTGGLEVW